MTVKQHKEKLSFVCHHLYKTLSCIIINDKINDR